MSRSTSPGGFLHGIERRSSRKQQQPSRSSSARHSSSSYAMRSSVRSSLRGSRSSSPQSSYFTSEKSTKETRSSSNAAVATQKRQRFMKLQRQRIHRYVRWINFVLFDEVGDDFCPFERRFHGYNLVNYDPEPLSVETLFDRLKDGLILCSLVDTLETTLRTRYGEDDDTINSRTRFASRQRKSGSSLTGVHRKPHSKTSCCENIEKALSLIWKKGVMASNMPTSEDVYTGKKGKILVLLGEIFEAFVMRDVRARHLPDLMQWYRGINAHYGRSVFENDTKEIHQEFRDCVSIIVVFHCLETPEYREGNYHMIFWKPTADEELLLNVEFCLSIMETKDVPVLWDSEEMMEHMDTDFLWYQLYLIWDTFKDHELYEVEQSNEIFDDLRLNATLHLLTKSDVFYPDVDLSNLKLLSPRTLMTGDIHQLRSELRLQLPVSPLDTKIGEQAFSPHGFFPQNPMRVYHITPPPSPQAKPSNGDKDDMNGHVATMDEDIISLDLGDANAIATAATEAYAVDSDIRQYANQYQGDDNDDALIDLQKLNGLLPSPLQLHDKDSSISSDFALNPSSSTPNASSPRVQWLLQTLIQAINQPQQFAQRTSPSEVRNITHRYRNSQTDRDSASFATAPSPMQSRRQPQNDAYPRAPFTIAARSMTMKKGKQCATEGNKSRLLYKQKGEEPSLKPSVFNVPAVSSSDQRDSKYPLAETHSEKRTTGNIHQGVSSPHNTFQEDSEQQFAPCTQPIQLYESKKSREIAISPQRVRRPEPTVLKQSPRRQKPRSQSTSDYNTRALQQIRNLKKQTSFSKSLRTASSRISSRARSNTVSHPVRGKEQKLSVYESLLEQKRLMSNAKPSSTASSKTLSLKEKTGTREERLSPPPVIVSMPLSNLTDDRVVKPKWSNSSVPLVSEKTEQKTNDQASPPVSPGGAFREVKSVKPFELDAANETSVESPRRRDIKPKTETEHDTLGTSDHSVSKGNDSQIERLTITKQRSRFLGIPKSKQDGVTVDKLINFFRQSKGA